MIKYFLLFLFSFNLYAQEVNIPTKFSFDGSLYKNLNKNLNELSQPIVDFKEQEECFVVDYLGRDNYKVKYKEWLGIVSVDDLEVNEDMMDLYYAYQEQQRAKAIEVKNDRQRKIDHISQKEQESQKAIRAQFVDDSISKVVAQQQVVRKQFIKDSIAQVTLERELQRQQFIKDSIAKRKIMREKFVKDSVAKVKERQKLMREGFVKDSIAKVNLEKKLVREFFVKDSIAKVFARQKASRDQFVKDSIANVLIKQRGLREKVFKDSIKKELESQKITRNQFINDSLVKAVAKLKLIREQFIKDSISKSLMRHMQQREQFLKDSIANTVTRSRNMDTIPAEDRKGVKDLKNLEFRNTCHYAINEFDPFYNIKTIRTEEYAVAEDLTIELYKQGGKTNVFLNSKVDLGCVSYFSNNRSSVRVTLENDYVVSFYHSWDMQCGEFLFKGNLSQSKISALKKSPIKSIKLRGTEGSKEILKITYKKFFMDKLKCIED